MEREKRAMVKAAIWDGFYDEMHKIAQVMGFTPSVHEAITRAALRNLKRNEAVAFTPRQVSRVIEANKAVDYDALKTLFLDKRLYPYHGFSDYQPQTKRLIRDQMTLAKTEPNTNVALDALGTALHAQQDQWSHHVHGIKAGPRGLVRHIIKQVDDAKRWPQHVRQAVKDSEQLLLDVAQNRQSPLGKVEQKPRRILARLNLKDQ